MTLASEYVIMAKLNVETNICFKGGERWECDMFQTQHRYGISLPFGAHDL